MNLKKSKKPLLILIALSLFSASASTPAYAWIGGFHHRDIALWHGGRWVHGWHGGRLGWWWFAAGSWYFYTRPVYPYPDPYVPSTVIVQPQVVQPQMLAVQQPAPQVVAQAPAPPAAPAPQMWYQCKNPAGYYPYISNCPGGWTPVPASPTQ